MQNRAAEPPVLLLGVVVSRVRFLLTQLVFILLGHLHERTKLLRARNRLRISINISAKGFDPSRTSVPHKMPKFRVMEEIAY